MWRCTILVLHRGLGRCHICILHDQCNRRLWSLALSPNPTRYIDLRNKLHQMKSDLNMSMWFIKQYDQVYLITRVKYHNDNRDRMKIGEQWSTMDRFYPQGCKKDIHHHMQKLLGSWKCKQSKKCDRGKRGMESDRRQHVFVYVHDWAWEFLWQQTRERVIKSLLVIMHEVIKWWRYLCYQLILFRMAREVIDNWKTKDIVLMMVLPAALI